MSQQIESTSQTAWQHPLVAARRREVDLAGIARGEVAALGDVADRGDRRIGVRITDREAAVQTPSQTLEQQIGSISQTAAHLAFEQPGLRCGKKQEPAVSMPHPRRQRDSAIVTQKESHRSEQQNGSAAQTVQQLASSQNGVSWDSMQLPATDAPHSRSLPQ